MAKLPFSKLGVKLDTNIVLLPWGEYNIEVSKYLPMSEKTEMVSKIINKSSDNNGYYNPLKVKVYLALEVLYRYTNLSFTEKQKENELKLYDIIISSGLFDRVIELIPETEWKDLQTTVWDTISNIYEYKNSILGILETVSIEYERATSSTLLSPKI
jgi:hypothetical protein